MIKTEVIRTPKLWRDSIGSSIGTWSIQQKWLKPVGKQTSVLQCGILEAGKVFCHLLYLHLHGLLDLVHAFSLSLDLKASFTSLTHGEKFVICRG